MLLVNGDEQNLNLSTLYFFSHQAFCHFHNLLHVQGLTLEKNPWASWLLSFKIWSPAQIFWLPKILGPLGQIILL